MVTYEGIVKKLGFDPIYDPPEYDSADSYEDDSKPSQYHVLNEEEAEFLLDKMLKAKKEGILPLTPKK